MGGNDAPPPPDYAGANRAAIETDIATLPRRQQVLRQAALGLGEFTGLGDAEFGRIKREDIIKAAKEMAPALLQLQKDYGVDFVAEARKQLQASDPEAFESRKTLGEQINGASQFEDVTSTPTLGTLPTFENLSAPTTSATDGGGNSDAIRQALESQVLADINNGGNLSDDQRREIEQSVLKGQSANGNMLGNASEFQKAMQTSMFAEEQKRKRQQSAQDFLSSGQSTFDIANKLTQQNFANQERAKAFNNSSAQRTFANQNESAQQNLQNQLTALNQRNQMKQQNLANKQAFVFGQPLNSQFGNLQGAQNMAAPFSPVTAQAQATLNPNAGALGTQFASNIYNTQMQGYAATANPWSTALGAGTALGSAYLMGGK